MGTNNMFMPTSFGSQRKEIFQPICCYVCNRCFQRGFRAHFQLQVICRVPLRFKTSFNPSEYKDIAKIGSSPTRSEVWTCEQTRRLSHRCEYIVSSSNWIISPRFENRKILETTTWQQKKMWKKPQNNDWMSGTHLKEESFKLACRIGFLQYIPIP